jgi:superfamily II DNA or RNA helicase
MDLGNLKPGTIVRGPMLPEPVEVLVVTPLGDVVKLTGAGQKSGQVHQRVLTKEQLQLLVSSPDTEPFDGDPLRFKLGVEAARLGLAYEYDPYFSLSIARVDPLPHQLEAVYDYFLKLPRIRFLLADDPGAGKTIMAGLLLKELKIRGLVTRTLIVAPANLTFQWQRELKDKFREQFDVMRGEVLRTQYGQNPWQERNQVVTSVSWISRVEDAKESLLRSSWDLVIVDEAHKMSAYSSDKRTLAFQIGEELSERTDHFLLMTATPHKGDPENFRLFLSLLDRDVYGDVKSLEEAMRRHEAPFYLRRLKEALVSFPDPETGAVKKLFTNRDVRTTKFELDGDEFDFYDALTRYVEDQSIKAAAAESVQANILSFQMAMLQRRFASSIYAVRRSLERMRDKRRRILEDPERYRQELIDRRLPDDFEDLPEDEQAKIMTNAEEAVLVIDPVALRDEIQRLDKLVDQARALEKREIESKLKKLRQVLNEQQIFSDPRMKLLVFTEHKDTLDYLAGDGRDGRPLGKLREWGLTVTQIHGAMPIGDRDTPGTRICAEREFREDCQVLVATEAAGEGINLQFCWLMINYDIPWNPVRLEQRMGRIHRYGQQNDCLIFNFAAVNTREGRVLEKLLMRLAEIKEELGTDKVFDVVGEMLPSNLLEKMFREMYAKRLSESSIADRIVKDIDPERFKRITGSTLEGLAKKELNLSALVGKSVEAKERRLVPEVVEDFFVASGPIAGVHPSLVRGKDRVYRIGRLPKTLSAIGERLEPRFGRLGREYQRVVFDKQFLGDDATLEWVTPGHPLFEVVRSDVSDRVEEDLRRGSVLWDLHAQGPYRLDVFAASIKDGRANTLHKKLFVVRAEADGTLSLRQPTLFLDLIPAAKGTAAPEASRLPGRDAVELFLVQQALNPFLAEVTTQRANENRVVREHIEISLQELINRQQISLAELLNRRVTGENIPGLEGNISQAESHLDELNARLERRRLELEMERHCSIGDLQHVGRSWVLPHPERHAPGIAPMVSDPEIEKIAVRIAMEHERARGWVVESVEDENRGYDLLSKRPHPSEPGVFVQARFIEVKGRAGTGEIALTANEYRTAQRLGDDFWLYVVFECSGTPALSTIQDPARLGWVPVVKVEHYHVPAKSILAAAEAQSG